MKADLPSLGSGATQISNVQRKPRVPSCSRTWPALIKRPLCTRPCADNSLRGIASKGLAQDHWARPRLEQDLNPRSSRIQAQSLRTGAPPRGSCVVRGVFPLGEVLPSRCQARRWSLESQAAPPRAGGGAHAAGRTDSAVKGKQRCEMTSKARPGSES